MRLELSPGQVLFREGTTAGSGYVVAFGGIEMSIGQAGKRKVVMTCEAGSLIGELALFIETKRPATATAVVSTEVLDIDRKLVTRMLNEYPHVAVRLARSLAGRLTATIGELGKIQNGAPVDRHALDAALAKRRPVRPRPASPFSFGGIVTQAATAARSANAGHHAPSPRRSPRRMRPRPMREADRPAPATGRKAAPPPVRRRGRRGLRRGR